MFYFVSCIVWIYSVWFFIQTFSNIPSVSSKVWSRYLSRIVVEVSIFIWIMYFKVFEYLYFLFHFYFNYVILLFTIWLDLTILVKIFYLRFYDFMIRVYDSSLYCMFRVMSKKRFWQRSLLFELEHGYDLLGVSKKTKKPIKPRKPEKK